MWFDRFEFIVQNGDPGEVPTAQVANLVCREFLYIDRPSDESDEI